VAKIQLSVRNAIATEFIGMALNMLAIGKFKGICVEIADIIFHSENLESLANSPFSARAPIGFFFWCFDYVIGFCIMILVSYSNLFT
jgi:hypothetical protein